MKLRIMFNVKIKLAWTMCLMLVTMAISAQEICNNGIDDDGDALIDLNDDECDCDAIEPLTYVNGSLCRRLDLELEYPGASSYQWYKDGIAIAGETSDRISITRWDPMPEGEYVVRIEHPGGCVTSEPYDAVLNSYDTDLGEVFLCTGDTLIVAGFPFFKEGFQQTKTVAIDGCDSLIVFEIKFVDPTTDRLNVEMCEGGTYINGSIMATEPGIYLDTIFSTGGCDSLIIRVNLMFEPLAPVEFDASICAGETYNFYDLSETTSGRYEITESGECDTMFIVNLTVRDEIEEKIDASICSGGLYELGDISTSDPGEHRTTFQTAEGCDSTVIVNLTIDDTAEHRFQETICQGKIFEQGSISTGDPGEYSYTSTEGACDSLIIIELTVTPPDQMVTDEIICSGKSVEWRGNTFDAEGTYTDLERNPGECDIEHVLNVSFEAIEENIDAQIICEGESYTWRGTDYKEEGRYEELSVTPGECDVMEVLDLTVLLNTTGFVEATLCAGDTYDLFDLSVDAPGSYIATTTNSVGCDSIITVELLAGTIGPIYVEEAICPGDFFTFYGEDYDTEGTYTANVPAVTGCDSIIVLELSINNLIEVSYDMAICEGDSYQLHDLDENTTGTYTTNVSTGTGCDSLVTLNLTVLEQTSYDFQAQICDGDVYSGLPDQDLTEEGSYMAVLQNAAGCDSIVTLTLTVLNDEPFSRTEEICTGDTFIGDGIEASEAGRYESVLTSVAGCDSTVVIDLQVLPLNQRVEDLKICPGDIVPFFGQDITEAGSYTERFSNENGCDSIVTLNIEMNASVGDIELQDTVLVNLGGSTDIEPIYVDDSFISYQWLDNEANIMSLDRILTDYAPADDTWIEFVAVNEFGCEIRERIAIDVELIVDIYAPNVIQPDLDLHNAYFTLGGNESVVGIQELNIFDRWGERVFTDSHVGKLESYIGWNGEYKGNVVKPGVFTWAAVFEIIDGSFVKKAGTVTVIR